MTALFDFLYDQPILLVRVLVGVSLVAFALGGLAIARRFVLPRLRMTEDDAGFSGAMVQAVLIFYGLVVTLIAVNTWQNYSDVSGAVSNEAGAIVVMYRNVSGYPEPIRTQARSELREYVGYIIHDAWPLQHKGIMPSGGVDLIDKLQTTLFSFEPTTEGQKLLHAATINAYDALIVSRLTRLDAVVGGLPGLLWMVVIMGSVVSLISTFFFRVEDARLHGTLVVLLAVFISLVVVMIFAFDRPFRGDLGLQPTSYQLIYDDLMAR